MDMPMSLPDFNPATLPAARTQRAEAGQARSPQVTADAGTQVSISAEARAADAAARAAGPGQTSDAPALPQGGAQSANPVSALAQTEVPAATTAATSATVDTAETAIAERSSASPQALNATTAAPQPPVSQTVEALAPAAQGGVQSANPAAAAPSQGPAAPTDTAQAGVTERGSSSALQREPDASSASTNAALQLYLENAVRPDNQGPPSAFRESA